MKRLFSWAVLVAALCLALGSTARADEPPGWGTIKGSVAFDGTPPAPMEADVDKDQGHCLSKGKIFKEKWVINSKNKGVANVYVWLVDPSGKDLPIHPALKDVPKDEVKVDQPCCKFEPHCMAVREGQRLVFTNSAPVAHNVNYQGGKDNESGNVLLPPGGEKKLKDLKHSDFPLVVACNIHPWMSGWVRVFNHPYYAITDADGKFVIKNAPVGTYQLVIWHEDAGWGPGGKKGQPITIKANGDTEVGKVEIKPSE